MIGAIELQIELFKVRLEERWLEPMEGDVRRRVGGIIRVRVLQEKGNFHRRACNNISVEEEAM